ncbi:hypothetical protein C9I98_01845 [Photobacterium sanctipauli]|uniref:Uncharacterized protein n=1 Tax=Photobacterium sanctipauli TaxID=1342794 RepID=A0A2T3P0M7_9GAMM|nr:hypothetical protein [Photobacterium sanctipauli]PSW22029.1 hypothetical protein C9I98_01845 [Photobacterium sanctipauli]
MQRYTLQNNQFTVRCNAQGILTELLINKDTSKTNWVVNHDYLNTLSYQDCDKLFGNFSVVANNLEFSSQDIQPIISNDNNSIVALYSFDCFDIKISYQFDDHGHFIAGLCCENTSNSTIDIKGLHLWLSLANVMYRDLDVERNMAQSCAVFNHLSGEFSKFAAIKRSNLAPHLGVYQHTGRTEFMGTYCRYTNRFFEQVSPSLDGVIYHRASLVEDGETMPELKQCDWLYQECYQSKTLAVGERLSASYLITPIQDQQAFYTKAGELGQPVWDYSPVITSKGEFNAKISLISDVVIDKAEVSYWQGDKLTTTPLDITTHNANNQFGLTFKPNSEGEHKLEITLNNGLKDKVIFNVLPEIAHLLEQRADWLVRKSYSPDDTTRPNAFLPLSNQGESLGKVAFVLIKNVLGSSDIEQIRSAEHCAAYDIRPHWFTDGDFTQPARLYDGFYRIFDLDFIGQIYFLLSQLDEVILNDKVTYLDWAYQVLRLRLDPELHHSQREKEETEINGPFVYYAQDVIDALASNNMAAESQHLAKLWQQFGEKMVANSNGMKGAITEHFYDNAGFGPTCKTLLLHGHTKEAKAYAELMKANIGFSNDYRMQSPDRWWEALAPMNHSLWGGLVASASLAAYEGLLDRQCLHQAYAASMAMFNCYDYNVKSSPKPLAAGEAASTFCCTAPNLNDHKLSRSRFGQDAFGDDLLFANASGIDWDMGQELVTYCQGFGISTYLLVDEHGIQCVNGMIDHSGSEAQVISYAAWPRRFVIEDNGQLRIVHFDNDQPMIPLSELLK